MSEPCAWTCVRNESYEIQQSVESIKITQHRQPPPFTQSDYKLQSQYHVWNIKRKTHLILNNDKKKMAAGMLSTYIKSTWQNKGMDNVWVESNRTIRFQRFIRRWRPPWTTGMIEETVETNQQKHAGRMKQHNEIDIWLKMNNQTETLTTNQQMARSVWTQMTQQCQRVNTHDDNDETKPHQSVRRKLKPPQEWIAHMKGSTQIRATSAKLLRYNACLYIKTMSRELFSH